MKKITTYLLVLLGCVISVALKAQTTIYTSNFDSQTEFNTYTLLNNGDGTRNWDYNSTKKSARYWGSASNASAWLISPSLSLEAGKTYKLTFKTWLSSTTSASYKNIKVTTGQGTTTDSQTKVLHSESIKTSTATNTIEVLFDVDQTGLWNIGFNCYGSTNSNDIYIDDISVVNIPATPKAINNLAVTVGDNDLSAAITWNNPEKSLSGATLTSLTKVELYRNNDLIYTNSTPIIGAEDIFNDLLPLAGKYSYKIVAYNEEGASEFSTAIEKWIGPKEITLPYTSSFIDGKNDFDIYTIVDSNADNKTWTRNLYSGLYVIAYTSYVVPNDWIFMPKFKGEKGDYKLTLYWRTYDGLKKETMDITLGKSVDPASHTTILNNNDQNFSSGLFSTKTIDFTISDNDDYYIGFHLYSSAPWGIYITDIHLERLGQSVSVNTDKNEKGISYNSAKKTLSIKYVSEVASVAIYNLAGVSTVKTNMPQSDLDLNTLTKGIYIAKCTYKSGETEVVKFTKD